MWASEKVISSKEWNEVYKQDMKESIEIEEKVNQEMYYHLKRYYSLEWKLDIDWFLKKSEKVVNELFNQSWEKNNFWNIDNFREFIIKWLKLSILDYNLDFETSEKLRKSMLRFCYMYWEIVEFWEKTTDWVKKYLEKNRNNEQKKEEIKKLVERDYELFFWESSKWKALNTNVWQTTNEIIEVFSNWYYGSLNSEYTTK